MKRLRKAPPSPVDLADVRKRAMERDQRREVAAAWLAQLHVQARRLLAAGAEPTPEVARLLHEVSGGLMRASYTVDRALSVADAEQVRGEQIASILEGATADYREYVESQAAKGSRADQLALEIAKGRQ